MIHLVIDVRMAGQVDIDESHWYGVHNYAVPMHVHNNNIPIPKVQLPNLDT